MTRRFTLSQLGDYFDLQNKAKAASEGAFAPKVPVAVPDSVKGTAAEDAILAEAAQNQARASQAAGAGFTAKQKAIEAGYKAVRTPEELAALPPGAATSYALRALGVFGPEAVPADYPVGKGATQPPTTSQSPSLPIIRKTGKIPHGLGVPKPGSSLNAKDLLAQFNTVSPNKALTGEQNGAFSPRIAVQAQKMLAAAGLSDLSAYGGPGPRFQAAVKAKTLARLIDALSGRRATLDANQLSRQGADLNNQRSQLASLANTAQRTGADTYKSQLNAIAKALAPRASGKTGANSRKGKGKAPTLGEMQKLFSAMELDANGNPKDPTAYQAAQAYLDTVANTQGSESPTLQTLANQRLSQILPDVANNATPYFFRGIPGSDTQQLRDGFTPILNSANPVQNLAASGAFAFDPSSRQLAATQPINGVEPSDVPQVGLNMRDPVSRYIAAALLRNRGQ